MRNLRTDVAVFDGQKETCDKIYYYMLYDGDDCTIYRALPYQLNDIVTKFIFTRMASKILPAFRTPDTPLEKVLAKRPPKAINE